jgi:hypothetical protein
VAALAAACAGNPTAPAPSPQGDRAGPSARGGGGDDEGMEPYGEVITADMETDEGIFKVHRDGEELFYEIPNAMLGKEMLLVTSIARTATDLGYGGQQANNQVVRWVREGDRIHLRIVQHDVVADSTLPIATAVANAHFEPIIRAFDIEAMSEDSSAVVIDAAELFTTDVPILGLRSSQRSQYQVRRLDPGRTYITSVNSYPQNIEVKHVLTYDAGSPPANSSTGTISVEMNQSMVLLPEDPMQPRLFDPRVGYFGVSQVDYGLEAHRAESRRYITRWRLEPSDPAAFARGELVAPVKPIVYYVDPATPVKWRQCLKDGVDDWNVAFEAAGFRNAIEGRMPPTAEEDPEFSPEDARYSVIRYYPSDIANASGPHVHDPRTGEILESDINWYHNVMTLVRNWFFAQTSGANPLAQSHAMSDETMCQLIRFVSSHEVGHTIGLQHNMKSSAAYPVDSLRVGEFTQRMGTAPSIMDYARFNYIAQPEDEGINFYPAIGPYDKWAIEWGYRPIPQADSPDEERATLNKWVKAHDDPLYYFAGSTGADPTSQSEALGDDGVLASEYGILNLQRSMKNLVAWTTEPGEDYAELEELYGALVGQWNRYLGHVATIVGGVERTFRTADQPGDPFRIIPEAEQRRAVGFFTDQVFTTPTWLANPGILAKIGNPSTVDRLRSAQTRGLGQLLNTGRLERLLEQEAQLGNQAYTLGELFTDVRAAVWTELQGARPADIYRRNLQRAYVDQMASLKTPPEPTTGGGFGGGPVDPTESDIAAFARGELVDLDAAIGRALPRVQDRATRLHLQDVRARIDAVLNPAG